MTSLNACCYSSQNTMRTISQMTSLSVLSVRSQTLHLDQKHLTGMFGVESRGHKALEGN